jgi:hypothetical protein
VQPEPASFDFAGQSAILQVPGHVPIARNFITVIVLLEFL